MGGRVALFYILIRMLAEGTARRQTRQFLRDVAECFAVVILSYRLADPRDTERNNLGLPECVPYD